MILSAGTGDGLCLEGHDFQVVGQTPATRYRVWPRGQFQVLGCDPGWLLALVPIVIGPGGSAQLLVVICQHGIIVTPSDERGGCDGHRVRTGGARRAVLTRAKTEAQAAPR